MSGHDDPVTRVLSGARPIEPPPELRGPALARAEQAWAEAHATDRWRQIWESRPLRLAWAATAVALAAANLVVPLSRSVTPAMEAGPGHELTTRELQDAVSLPRLRSSYVTVDVATTPPEVAPKPASTGNVGKETRS